MSPRQGTLPEDIWRIVANHYLAAKERSSLSLTCREIGTFIRPILFKNIIFRGYHREPLPSLRQYYASLLYSKKRLEQLLQNRQLHVYIRNVMVADWVYVPFFLLCVWKGYPRAQNLFRLQSEFLSLWIANYRAVVKLIGMLQAHARTVTFWEPSVCAFSSDYLWHGIEFSRTSLPPDQCPGYLMVEFLVPDDFPKTALPSNLSSYMSHREIISSLSPDSEAYMESILKCWEHFPVRRAVLTWRLHRLYAVDNLDILQEFGVGCRPLSALSQRPLGPEDQRVDIFGHPFALKKLLLGGELEVNEAGVYGKITQTSLQNLTVLGGRIRVVSALVPHCPKLTELHIEGYTTWPQIKSALDPELIINITSLHLHQLSLDIRSLAQVAAYFPNLKQLKVRFFSIDTFLRNPKPSPEDLLNEMLQLFSVFRNLMRLRVSQLGGIPRIWNTLHRLDIPANSADSTLTEIQISDRYFFCFNACSKIWSYHITSSPSINYESDKEVYRSLISLAERLQKVTWKVDLALYEMKPSQIRKRKQLRGAR